MTANVIANPTKLAQNRPAWVGWLLGALAAASVEIGERVIVVIWGWHKWYYIFTESLRLLLKGVVGFFVFTAAQYGICYLLGGRGSFSKFTSLMGYAWLPLSVAAVVIWPILGFIGLSPWLAVAAIGAGGIWSVILGVGVMRATMAIAPGKAVLVALVSLAFGYFFFQVVY